MTPILAFYASNLIMLPIYIMEIPFFERYRILPNKPWPWKENKEEWRKTFKKTMINIIIN